MEKTEILKVRNGKTQNKKTEEFADETDDRKAEHLVCQSRLYRGRAGSSDPPGRTMMRLTVPEDRPQKSCGSAPASHWLSALPSASWTVTGSGACVLGKTRSRVKITGATTGKIIDYGLKDNQNMGACMAPAACDTIAQNLVDFNREPADYDRIVTGDLGVVGREILLELLKKKGYDISEQHSDCGMLIFDPAKQDTGAGGSGCGCAASVLAEYLLPKLENGEWKRILFVPTGALMSKVSFQEGSSVPGIAQAVVIEREEDV